MRTAGALAVEVQLFESQEQRLPTAEELADELDDALSYLPRPVGYTITNTDGVRVVTYEGSPPVSEWLAASGCTLPGRRG